MTMVSVGEISLVEAARGEGEVVSTALYLPLSLRILSWEGAGLVIFIVHSRHSE
jgi:hypothetical protein